MDRLILMLLAFMIIIMGITLLLSKVAKKIKPLKYIPGILCFLLSIYLYYLARFVRAGEGFEDLGRFLLALILFAGGLSGLTTSLILEYRDRSSKNK